MNNVRQDHKFQYITFILERDTGKTQLWRCQNIEHGDKLGQIQWYGPWRQYCFVCCSGVVLSAGCLKDVQVFIERLMEAHKNEIAARASARNDRIVDG